MTVAKKTSRKQKLAAKPRATTATAASTGAVPAKSPRSHRTSQKKSSQSKIPTSGQVFRAIHPPHSSHSAGSCGHHHGDEPATETRISQARERLKSAGHKLTRPREALLQTLTALPAPFSVEEVHHAVHSSEKIDLVTVYRSLATFAELALLMRVEFDDGVVRYEWADPNGKHHHHVVCTSCRRIEPLDLCTESHPLEGSIQWQERHLSRRGYTGLTHRLEFYGLCPECAATDQAPTSRE